MNQRDKTTVASEISQLKRRLESLIDTDEFCHLRRAQEKLDAEKEALTKKFRAVQYFLVTFNKFSKRPRSGCISNLKRFDAMARQKTERFLNKLKKVLDHYPEAFAIYDGYMRQMESTKTENELPDKIRKDMTVISEAIADNGRKQSALIRNLDERRREIQKIIKDREEELQAISRSLPSYQTEQMKDDQPATPRPTTVYSNHRRRKSRDKSHEDTATEIASPPPVQWKLRLVFNDRGEGTPMPQKRRDFVRMLDVKLKKEKIFHVNCNSLYDKLVAMGKLNASQRPQVMHRISGEGLCCGWYKLHSGTFRVLLDFKDEERVIKFLPATHDIYQKIWYSL